MGVEALVRWQHPTRGLISPGVFVPLAEENGLIVQLGRWVLREACSTFRSLRDQGVDIPRLAVNVAPSQFWADGFLDTVLTALKDAGLPTCMLELELTEGTVMRDLESGKRILAELRAAGIQLSVDDFGTGYSSLSYLQHLPLHALKIDRAFIHGLGQEGASDAIVAAIITLGKRLGLRLVAEGVEQAAQVETLRQLQCDELQGFLFSRPLSATALVDWCRGQPAPQTHS
jgi:EAL domain-containing protein (putative c-di-GMP-specific phosphodiesterase class I)